ncbi:Ran-binding protein 9/10 [Marchantia polymorpha subsp. ruderalis]|nr:hypothetical protein MARPO_0002s0237 [Marchantia polymorpha]BBN00100.1 hypothetical protein Mp_1g26410 [Marchantia polymorpha subsp. ruderalis]|eukprot:PTQ49786.1 hypothetical protein MARPO_0002s0237 [Marchantia polymorpha]
MQPTGGSRNLYSLYDWRRPEPKPEEEEVPTHLNTTTCGHFLVISTDKLSARYNGDGQHGHDVGAIQSNRPAPHQRLLYYFEISLKDRGQRGVISIGFTDENFKMSRQPGWEPNSYGYHGDDGLLYHGRGRGDSFGPTFTTGDTVGAGINYAAQELFFTKNGKLVGTHIKEGKGPLYPTIGLHSPSEKVEVNFGQKPFIFDIEAMVQEERERRQRSVESVPLPLSISHNVVRTYLLHYGYQDTLTAFDVASGGTFPPVVVAPEGPVTGNDTESYALEQRKILRKLTREGDIDGVFAKLREWYPELLQSGVSLVSFLLHCQKYIELVKAGSLEAAVNYARVELANFFAVGSVEDTHLQDCLALLAYEHPEKSMVSYLLHVAQREAVADAVNAVVLATNPANLGKPSQSALEMLLRQLTACLMEKRYLNGGQGEIFTLQRVLQGGKDGGW